MKIKLKLHIFLGYFIISILVAEPAFAVDKVGGHFGHVQLSYTQQESTSTSIADKVVPGFPMGVSLKNDNSKFSFDMEMIGWIQNTPVSSQLTLHPGILYSLSKNWTTGVRMAFEIGQPAWGFTPLLNFSFYNNFFIELPIPLRFVEVGQESQFQ